MIKSIFFLLTLCLFACSNQQTKLPILGTPDIIGEDTLFPSIPNFEFLNQQNKLVNELTFHNKIYVTDFMFLTCPTICPKMTSEMNKVYKHYESNNNILFLSHTIDPENDSIPLLLSHANQLKVNHSKWHFVTGKKEQIYDLAENSYFSAAYKDSTAPGGFVHSGGLLLIDKYKHIRGVYDGTNPKETRKLINDIHSLLREQF